MSAARAYLPADVRLRLGGEVATMVVLIEGERGAGAIDPAAASELARLGVTSVAVLHDDAGIGVVLEGWAFDPVRSGEQAAAIVASGRGRVRTLHPLLQAAISTGLGESRIVEATTTEKGGQQ